MSEAKRMEDWGDWNYDGDSFETDESTVRTARLSKAKTRYARKQHPCSSCPNPIAANTRYHDASTYGVRTRWHLGCPEPT